ncbi:MAG: GIY-YIG nuclease family protein [Thermodesulfobacteriota bacterium]
METKYLRMIQGMKGKGRKDWTVYILRCGDGSLYTGIAKDVRVRVKQHSDGRGATYTRTRLPVELLYQQEGLTRSEALIREAQIKAMPRSKKEEIILSERCVPIHSGHHGIMKVREDRTDDAAGVSRQEDEGQREQEVHNGRQRKEG